MRRALHAEWTKLRTVPGTPWLLLGTVALTVVLGGVAAAAVTESAGAHEDITRLTLTGLYLGQVVVAVLAVVAIGGEYGSGMIRVTLAATPRRLAVLVAKASVISGAVLIAGLAAVLGSLFAGRLVLPGSGFTAAHGYAALSLAHGPTLRAAAGSIVYLALIGLLSLGVATLVRDSAGAIGIVLGLLFVFPIIAGVVGSGAWHRHLLQIGPMTAGLAISATTNLATLPIKPWAGLGVLAAWAAGALAAGGLALAVRDA